MIAENALEVIAVRFILLGWAQVRKVRNSFLVEWYRVGDLIAVWWSKDNYLGHVRDHIGELEDVVGEAF